VRAVARRIARAYQGRCASEDVRRAGVAVPDGIWVCRHCEHVSLDWLTSRTHHGAAHAA